MGIQSTPYTLKGEWDTQCWHQLFYEAGVDNTFTSFKDTGASITAIFDDGCPDAPFAIADGTGGWTQQITAISGGITSILPDSLQNSSYCTVPNSDPPIGCAGLNTPVIFLPDMKWRYAGFRICPGDKAPIKFIYNSDQRQNIELDYNIKPTRVRYIDRCINKEANEIRWIFLDTGEDVPEEEFANGVPLCAKPCSQTFAAPPLLPICPRGIEQGCFFDANGNQTLAGVTMLYKFCDGSDTPQLQYLSNYGQETQEEVSPPEGGYFGDCASGEPVTPIEPEPECDPEVDWTLVSGTICDEDDSRFGEPVCWTQGINACGKIIFPDGAKCPEFYPAKFNLGTSGGGDATCQSVSASAAAAGLTEFGHGGGGIGANTHTLKLGQLGAGGSLAQQIDDDRNSTFDICAVTIEGVVMFVYDATTVAVTQGNLGSNGSIAFSSTKRTDLGVCQSAYDAIWDSQAASADSTANAWSRICTTFTEVAGGDPKGTDCTLPLDPQPLQVQKGDPPSTATAETPIVEKVFP